MSFKQSIRRERLNKKMKRGFRGYPVATVAYYGPTDQRASKMVVAILPAEDADPENMRKWFSEAGDVRTDPEIAEAVFNFLDEAAPKSVVVAEGIMGCPHEEGIDYPEGTTCPQCPFWRDRDRFTGRALH